MPIERDWTFSRPASFLLMDEPCPKASSGQLESEALLTSLVSIYPYSPHSLNNGIETLNSRSLPPTSMSLVLTVLRFRLPGKYLFGVRVHFSLPPLEFRHAPCKMYIVAVGLYKIGEDFPEAINLAWSSHPGREVFQLIMAQDHIRRPSPFSGPSVRRAHNHIQLLIQGPLGIIANKCCATIIDNQGSLNDHVRAWGTYTSTSMYQVWWRDGHPRKIPLFLSMLSTLNDEAFRLHILQKIGQACNTIISAENPIRGPLHSCRARAPGGCMGDMRATFLPRYVLQFKSLL
ncbi:hypothetical protein BS47DRAFT_75282 [Hydnum rufescens UP504]|uniref:Uncharacterized protein n=1 Tax=Hydnum rufescens UP504 TaxID=1448309 RepID=A0A9P6E1A4_9AGAM|nr:hypothetical protein BS47DRAFT_75282 [Hydnum rufescens UP504]